MKDEFTKKLNIKGLEHVWVNPKVYEAIRQEAKKEVFDDIEKAVIKNSDAPFIMYAPDFHRKDKWCITACMDYWELKFRHLSTFAEQKRHNSSSKKDCLKFLCSHWNGYGNKCMAIQEHRDKNQCSPS